MKKVLIEKVLKKEIKVKDASEVLGISRQMFHRIKKEYLKYGEGSLKPKKPGPKSWFSPRNKISIREERIICELALEYENEGPIPLSLRLLNEHRIERNPSTVYRVLLRNKIRYIFGHKGKRKKPILYVKDYPGEELQMDCKFPYGRSRKISSIDAIDDSSRTAFGNLYESYTDKEWIDCFKNHILPNAKFTIRAVRVDGGPGREFKDYLSSLGITLIRNDPYSPEKNGKIERFHRTLDEEFFIPYTTYWMELEEMNYLFKQYLYYYNNQRHHQGLGMNNLTPLEKLQKHFLEKTAEEVRLGLDVNLTMKQYKI
jgi:hypothetical protein